MRKLIQHERALGQVSEGRVFDLRLSSQCLLTLIVSSSELGSCLSPSFCSAEGSCFSCGKPSPLLVRLAFCKLLSIGLGHLLSQVHLLQDFPEVGLVNAGKEALVGTGEGLVKRRLCDPFLEPSRVQATAILASVTGSPARKVPVFK